MVLTHSRTRVYTRTNVTDDLHPGQSEPWLEFAAPLPLRLDVDGALEYSETFCQFASISVWDTRDKDRGIKETDEAEDSRPADVAEWCMYTS